MSIFIVVNFITIFSYASINSPKINCVSVVNNNVQLEWIIPSDPLNEFVSYNIFFSESRTGTYVEVGTVTSYLQNNYTHSLATTFANNAFFYITTSFSSGTSAITDTICPMYLQLDNTMEAVAKLSWNKIGIENPTSYYQIYKNKSGELSQWIDSTNNTTYVDSISVCSDSIYYKIEMAGDACISASNKKGELFQDIFAPSSPFIDSISVDPATGYVHIGWQQNPEGDVGGYVIGIQVPNNYLILDTVWGQTNTSYYDKNIGSFNQAEVYAVLAFDTCWLNGSPNTSPQNNPHKTIFLTGESDACSRSITINWNAYEGWSGIAEYKIYASVNGKPETVIATVGSSKISYTHDSLIANANYCYTVRAIDASRTKTSSSNRICITMLVPRLPQNHYLNKVTVNENEEIEVSCYVDNDAAIEYYLIERATSHNGNYEILDRIYTPTDTIITYIDSEVNPNTAIYYYKIIAVDVCGYEVNVSNISTNVFVKVQNKMNEFKNIISWNPYSDWDTLGSGVAFYNIYKGYSLNSLPNNPIAMVSGSEKYYEDKIGIDAQNEGEVCYFVEAIEGGGNLLAFKEKSLSNISCVSLEPVVYFPNAFTPNSDRTNDVFIPIMNFIPKNEYYFAIFSRYGHIIFETKDPDEGWTGGNYPTGVYNYKIVFYSSTGNQIEQVGAVTLIK